MTIESQGNENVQTAASELELYQGIVEVIDDTTVDFRHKMGVSIENIIQLLSLPRASLRDRLLAVTCANVLRYVGRPLAESVGDHPAGMLLSFLYSLAQHAVARLEAIEAPHELEYVEASE